MLTIRLPKADWGKASRAMIEIAPVRLVADNPVYEVLPAHLELLTARLHLRGRAVAAATAWRLPFSDRNSFWPSPPHSL